MTNVKKLRSNEIVQIVKLDSPEMTVYLMKMANFAVRPYITWLEANRVATYMRKVVDAIIQKTTANKNLTGRDLVKIEPTTTTAGTFYFLTIADMDIRGYVEGYESLIDKNFFVDVVNEIIKECQ